METILHWYLGLSTVFFVVFCIVWTHNDWFNLLLKVFMVIAAVNGIVLSLNAFGFIVKV